MTQGNSKEYDPR